MSTNEMTFEKLPEAVNALIQEVKFLRTEVLELSKSNDEKSPNDFIDINEAAKLLHKSKATIYSLVSKSIIPHYKNGQKLFFSQEELIEWIRSGKKLTTAELVKELTKSDHQQNTRRPHKY